MSAEAITVMSYNVASGFSDGNKVPALLEQVALINPTVAVFPEAYRTGHGDIHDAAVDDLGKMGYRFVAIDQEVPQDDVEMRPDARALLVIAKESRSVDIEPVQLAGRYALRANMFDLAAEEPYEFFGHHGNDASEELRVADIEVLIKKYLPLDAKHDSTGLYIARPTLYAGDGNTMKQRGALSMALRNARHIVDRLPSVAPNPDEKQPKLARIGSMSQRLSQMAIGTPLSMLEEVGLYDIDGDNEPTMRKGPLAVKIDHIMASRDFEAFYHRVIRGLTVDGDVNGKKLSDHDMLVGMVRL